MTPRLALSMLAAALLIGACSASDDTATTSTPGSSATDAQPGATTTTTGVPAATTATATPATTTPISAKTTAPTTEVPSSTSAPTTVTDTTDDDFTDPEANDRDAARTVLITLSDFPAGWVEDPIDDDDIGTDEFEADFDACLGRDDDVRVSDELDRLKVGTGDFHPVDVDTTTVSHEVALAPDVETALAVMTEVRIDGAETCLGTVIGDFYRTTFADDPELADVDVGDVLVTRTEQDSDPDIAVGVLLEVPLTIGDQTVSQFLELLYQRQGRALSELSFASFGAPFSRDGYTVLSDEVIIRLATIGD